MDWYRLSSAEEVEGTGAVEYFDGTWVALVEWAHRGKDLLPGDTIYLTIDILSPQGRRISITGPDVGQHTNVGQRYYTDLDKALANLPERTRP